MLSLKESVQKSLNESSRLGKDLELSDLEVGFPIAVEIHGGVFDKAHIVEIRGTKIFFETNKGNTGNLPFDSNKISLPTYGTPFTLWDGTKNK